MRTFTQSPKVSKQATAAPSTGIRRAGFGRSREADSIVHLQHIIGYQADQTFVKPNAVQREVGLINTASPRFAPDFSRIPIHPPPAATIQPKLFINQPRNVHEQPGHGVAEQPVTSAAPLLIQRKCACGNQTVTGGECEECSKTKRFGLQTKLKVNHPRDIYEQEADRIADQVMTTPADGAVSSAPPRIQRLRTVE